MLKRKSIWVLAAAVLGFILVSGRRASVFELPSPPRPEMKVHVVPWLELSPLPGAFEEAVEGLEYWRNVTDTVIISVDPKNTRFLKELRKRIPEMRYIPGLKTSPILRRTGFDSVQGWRQIATSAAELREYTDSKVLLLENETSIKAYIDGKAQINWKLFEAGLKNLPNDTRILWYPSAAMGGETLQRYLRLCRSVEILPNVVFVDHAKLYAPRQVNQPSTHRAVRALREVAARPPVPLIYCCGDKWWPYERVPEAIALAGLDWVIIYPGQTRWIEAAMNLSERLPSLEPSTRSAAGDTPRDLDPGVQDRR